MTQELDMTPMRAIVLDETREVSQRAHRVLRPLGVQITFTASVQELNYALTSPPSHELLVVNLAGSVSGWQIADQIRRAPFNGRTIVLLDDLSRPDASCLTELPSTECAPKPSSPVLLDELLKRAANMAPRRPERDVPAATSPRTFYGMVGKSAQMLETFSRVEKVAAGDASVCIFGESGTGKELIARAIHAAGARRDRPLVTLDCTAVPEGLMESHLFGHTKGAFTGAIDHRDGVFALANTGTLFMDELCELSWPLQSKLLRVLQTREFVKVGGTKPIRTDIRLITATNKDPKNEMRRGAFREDLYYRIAVVIVQVPPLRERKEDIPLLVEHFIRKFSAAYRKPIRGVTAGGMERIMGLPWPGNVRQLQNFIEQAIVLTERDTLSPADLFLDDQAVGSGTGPSLQLEPGLPLSEVERRYLLRTLQQVHGNRTEAARILRISVRCLQYKLKSYLQVSTPAAPSVRAQSVALEEG